MSDIGGSTSVSGTRYDARWLYAPTGRKGIAQGKAKRRPGFGTQQKSLALKGRNRRTSRCQAPGAEPGRMLANRRPKSVPGTRCGARSMLANGPPNRCQAPGAAPGQMLANRWPRAAKSVPGTRRGAGADASKQWPSRCQAPGAEPGRMLANSGQVGARHKVRSRGGC